MVTVERYRWSRLNRLQLGKYAEYFVKMEFTMLGFDVYSSEVDDRGIDFVVRREPVAYYDIQVKSKRGLKYIFFPKEKFELRRNLFAAIAIFRESKLPDLYLIPSEEWKHPDALLKDRVYGQGRKSPPEWGLNLSERNLPLLARFAFREIASKLALT